MVMPANMPAKSPESDEIDEREDCPRCGAINWGMTPDDLLECVSCGFVEPR